VKKGSKFVSVRGKGEVKKGMRGGGGTCSWKGSPLKSLLEGAPGREKGFSDTRAREKDGSKRKLSRKAVENR